MQAKNENLNCSAFITRYHVNASKILEAFYYIFVFDIFTSCRPNYKRVCKIDILLFTYYLVPVLLKANIFAITGMQRRRAGVSCKMPSRYRNESEC